jgi:hypothetical protein
VIHALHGIHLDVGFLVSGEGDVGKDDESLRAIGDIEGAVEVHFLHAAFFASVWSSASVRLTVLS